MCENCERLMGKIVMLQAALAATDADVDAWLCERDQRVRRKALEEAGVLTTAPELTP